MVVGVAMGTAVDCENRTNSASDTGVGNRGRSGVGGSNGGAVSCTEFCRDSCTPNLQSELD